MSDSVLLLICMWSQAIIEHELALLLAHGLDFARHTMQWRGIDKGYSGFHSYEDINLMNIFTWWQQVSIQRHGHKNIDH